MIPVSSVASSVRCRDGGGGVGVCDKETMIIKIEIEIILIVIIVILIISITGWVGVCSRLEQEGTHLERRKTRKC